MPNYALFLVLVIACCFGSLAKGHQENASALEMLSVEKRWGEIEVKLKNVVNQGIEMIIPLFTEKMEKMNISSTCLRDTRVLIEGAREVKYWAMKIIGANSGMLTGITFDTMSAMGAYDECVNTQVVTKDWKDGGEITFRGKYCTVAVRPPLPPKAPFYFPYEVPIELKNFSAGDTILADIAKYANVFHSNTYHIGFCVPSGCLKSDLSQLADSASETTSLQILVKRCEVKEATKFTPILIAIISAYGIIMLLVLAGSLLDHYLSESSKKNSTILEILLLFSIKRSFEKLFNIPTSPHALTCLSAIRVIALNWIISSHTNYFLPKNIIRGTKDFTGAIRDTFGLMINRSTLAVEIFFFISGLLSYYGHIGFIKDLRKPKNFFMYLSHRNWRFLPSLLCVIGLIFLSDLMGDGPVWHDVTHDIIQGCYDNWWTNLLFINNIVFMNNGICHLATWYIACDMQLFIFTLLALVLLAGRPKFGAIFLCVCIVASVTMTSAVVLLKGYPPIITYVSPEMESEVWSYIKDIHFMPFVYASTYAIGVLAGYLLITKPKLKLPMIIQVLGWCAFFLCVGSVYYGPRNWTTGQPTSTLDKLIYNSCSRVAWSSALAWMIICCATGHAGVINSILSWKAWIPIGRLTYQAYLIHPVIQYICYGMYRVEISSHFVALVSNYFKYLVATYAIALLMYLIIDTPLVALEKYILFREEKKAPSVQGNDGCMMKNVTNCPPDENSSKVL